MYVNFVKTGNFFAIIHVNGRQLLMKQNVADTKKWFDEYYLSSAVGNSLEILYCSIILKYLQNKNLKNWLFEIVDT